MSNLISTFDVPLRVSEAFDVACLALFRTHMRHLLSVLQRQVLFPQFVRHYHHLCTLPRRTWCAIERNWKRTLSVIALLLAMEQGSALAASLSVAQNTPPDINDDGRCSLIEAIINVNRWWRATRM